MFWFVISIVVTIAIIVHIWRENLDDIGFAILGSVLTIVISVIATLFIVVFSSMIISTDNAVEYSKVDDISIIALKDNQNINGRFYLTGGYIDEELYYYYAIETEFGYKTEKIKADNAYIKYTDEKPHIEKYEGDFINQRRYFWGMPWYDDRYIIYCPDGTVTNEFNVDLE